MINLHIEPGVTKTWETFCKDSPPFSIALDGYVKGQPRYEPKGPFLNLNHHEDVDRLATRSTGGQVYMYIKQRLFSTFQKEGIPYAHLFVNDPDQDTSLAVYLLKNHERISGERSEPLINRLLTAEDLLDTTAGAYPFSPESDLMRDVAWIFEPYTSVLPRLYEMDSLQMSLVIESVGERIGRYSMGKGEKRIPDTSFEEIYRGEGWSMVKEKGNYARTGLFNKGILAFVSHRGESPKHIHRYSIGRMSPFVQLPLQEIYQELNRRENIPEDTEDKWGGSNTIGGSPRQRGSTINPGQLSAIIDEFLRTQDGNLR